MSDAIVCRNAPTGRKYFMTNSGIWTNTSQGSSHFSVNNSMEVLPMPLLGPRQTFATYLLVFLLQLSSLVVVRLFLPITEIVPHFSQFLCHISNGDARISGFDFRTELWAKEEKARSAEWGGKGGKKKREYTNWAGGVIKVYSPTTVKMAYLPTGEKNYL